MKMARMIRLLPLLLIAAPTLAEELRWKFQAGEEYVATIDQRSEVTSTISGTASVMTSDTGMQLVWKVESVDDHGNATIRQRFDRLRMTLEMPKAGPISYDSAKADESRGDAKTIADAVQPLLEASVAITLSPRGEITDVAIDDSIQQAVAKLSNAKGLQSLLSKEGLTNVLKQSLVVLPEGEVQPESTWKKSTELDTPFGKMKHVSNYKLLESEGRSADIARIELSAMLEPDAASAKAKSRLKSQQQTGLILFDKAAGRLKSATVDQEIVTETSLKDTTIQVQLVSSLKVTLEPK